jgi:NADH:ubiquinone oxidoreductase subunit 6 (subunit J)
MAAGRDTTLLTPSSNRWEDPVATTRHCSHSLLSLAVVSVSISFVMNYIVDELVLLLLVVNYIVDLIMCVIFVMYSLSVLEAPRPGWHPKQTVVKK